jgi:hypothetical protein
MLEFLDFPNKKQNKLKFKSTVGKIKFQNYLFSNLFFI